MVTFKDFSKDVLKQANADITTTLTKIGIAAKRNVQDVVIAKNIYDTGELHRTIDYYVNEQAKTVDVGSLKNYAAFQELGTSRQPARPFIRPGILDNSDQYKKIAEKA